MKKLLLTLFFISNTTLALGPDLFIQSPKETVFGQRLVSGQAKYIENGNVHAHNIPHSKVTKLAKENAFDNALNECENISQNAIRVSSWTIHKIVSCSDIVCYGTEYGNFVATALFECN